MQNLVKILKNNVNLLKNQVIYAEMEVKRLNTIIKDIQDGCDHNKNVTAVRAGDLVQITCNECDLTYTE